MKKKIIIDTDPGIDDALAILFAIHHPGIELLGLTSVFGNVSVELATENALRLVELAGVDIPVCKGAAAPLLNKPKPYPDFVHGKNGFGGIELPVPLRQEQTVTAAQFIADKVREAPDEVYLVPIGPLSNIALAIELAPDIVDKVAGVVLMGGAAFVPGNVNPAAEANIWNDPHAAEIVFAAGWPVTMVGLDVTQKTTLDQDFFDNVQAASPKQGGFLNQIHQFYLDFYFSRYGGERTCAAHDALAVVAVVEERMLTLQSGAIAVSCEGIATGQTLFAPVDRYNHDPFWAARPRHKAAIGVSAEEVRQLLLRTLALAE